MSNDDRIDVIVTDAVAPTIEPKILAIADASDKAESALGRLKAMLASLDSSPMQEIAKALNLQSNAADKSALMNQKLQTELARTEAMQAKAELATMRAAAAQEKLAQATAARGESEQQASSRIQAMVAASVAEQAAHNAVASSAAQAASATDRLSASNAAAAKTSQDLLKRQNESMQIATDQINDLRKFKDAQQQAAQGLDSVGKAAQSMGHDMSKGAFETAGARRELIVLAHEVVSGNFSRIPGSLMVLTERMGAQMNLLSPMAIGFGLTAVAVGTLTYAIIKGHEEMVAMNNALLITSDYSGMTRDSARKLAEQMTATKEVTIGVANEIVFAFISSGKIGGEAIANISRFVSDFAKATGQDIEKIAPAMIKLFEDPIKGAEELNSRMHFLTVTQTEHIAALQRTGDVQAAQLELSKLVSDQMPKQAANVGILVKAYNELRAALSGTMQEMKDFGAEKTNSQKIDALYAKMKDTALEANAGRMDRSDAIAKIKDLQNELNALNPLVAKEKEVAAASAETAKQNQQQSDSWKAIQGNSTVAHITQLNQLKQLIALKNTDPDKDPDVLKARLANDAVAEQTALDALQDQISAKRDATRKVTLDIQNAYRSIGQEARQLTQQEITNQEALRQITLKSGADEIETKSKLQHWTTAQHDEAMSENLLEQNASKQLYELQMMNVAGLTKQERKQHEDKLTQLKAEYDAETGKAINKQLVDQQQAYEDIAKSIQKVGDGELTRLNQAIDKQREHNAAIGQTASEKELVKQAIETERIAQNESDAQAIESAIKLNDFDAQTIAIYEMRIVKLREEAEARKKLAGLELQGAVKQASADAAKKLEDEFQSASKRIESDLESAIMDGGGRGAQRLVNDIKRYFAHLILSPILSPISQAISSALVPGAMSAGASIIGAGVLGSAAVFGSELATGFGAALGAPITGLTSGFGLIAASAGNAAIGIGMMLPAIGAVVAGLYVLGKLLDDGPEQNTYFMLGQNNKPGNLNINQRGNEGLTSAYDGPSAHSAFGTFGQVGTNWMDATGASSNNKELMGKWDAFMTSIQKSDDQIAALLTGAEKTSVIAGLNATPIKGSTGPEGSDPSIAFAQVFASRMNTILEGIQPGLSKLVEGFKGSGDQLQAEVTTLLSVRKNIDIVSKTFGEPVTLQGATQSGIVNAILGPIAGTLAELAKDVIVPNLTTAFESLKQAGETTGQVIIRMGKEFDATNTIATMFGKTQAEVWQSVGIKSATARDELISFAGGLDAFTQKSGAFYQNFFSNAERSTMDIAAATTQLNEGFGKLKLTLPTTITGYKDLMAAQDLSTVEGRNAYNSLMNLSGAFTVVNGTAEQLAQKVIEDAKKSSDLQIQYMQLTGDDIGALNAQRDIERLTMSESNKVLFDRNNILIDEQALAKKAAELTKANHSVQDDIDVLSGKYTQQQVDRTNELANATDSTTKALLLQKFTQQDLNAAVKLTTDQEKAKGDLTKQLFDLAHSEKEVLANNRKLKMAELALQDIALKLAPGTLEAIQQQIDAQTDLNAVLKDIGMSASTIAGDIKKGLLGTISAADLGGELGNVIVGGVYDALANGVANNITQMIMDNLVTPLMQDVLSGSATAASISSVISKAAIDSMIESATTAAKALAELFNNPEFKAAMELLKTSLNSLAGNIVTNGPVFTPYQAASTQSSNQSNQISTAYKDALDAIAKETKGFLQQIADIGKSSYEIALEKINTDAVQKLADLNKAAIDSGASAELQTKAKQKAAIEYGNAQMLAYQIGDYTKLGEALATYNAALVAANQITLDSSAVVEDWKNAQIALLNAQTQVKANNTIKEMYESLFALQHTDAENQAHLRTLKMLDLALQDKELNLADGTLESIQKQIDAQTDLNTELAKAAELLKINQAVQDKIDVLLGIKTQQQVDRNNELTDATNNSTKALLDKLYAEEDMQAAAKAATDAMAKLYAQMDKLTELSTSVGNSIQSVKQDSKGYDLAGYLKEQITKASTGLSNAVSVEDKIKAATTLQNAIVANYNNEKSMLADKAAKEKTAYDAGIAAQNKQIDLANQLSDAYDNIGQYAKSLQLGELSPLRLSEQVALAANQYKETIKAANAGDIKAAGNVQTDTGTYLKDLKSTSSTSVDYAREAAKVQNDLFTLSQKAQPKMEQITADGFEVSAGLQREMNDSQIEAINQLSDIQKLIDKWQADVQNNITEQAIIFTNLGLTSAQIALNTANLDTRIAAAIVEAWKAQGEAQSATGYVAMPTSETTLPSDAMQAAPPDNSELVAAIGALQKAVEAQQRFIEQTASATAATSDVLTDGTVYTTPG